MSSRNFHRRSHRRKPKTPDEGMASERQPMSYPECPVCKKPVRELPMALSYRATGTPAHFDCVLKELRESNEILPQEKLCYLGGGCFGILQYRANGSTKFTIKKKIPYEDKETQQDWKKSLLILG